MIIKGRIINPGKAEGFALKSISPISFYGGVDPETGTIIENGHDLEGACFKDKILVFKCGKGSTIGSYILYRLKKEKLAPAGIILEECETIIAVGCIISDIPCLDLVDIKNISTGDYIKINAEQGEIEIVDHDE